MRPQVMHVNYRKDHPHHRAQLAIWATAVGPWLRGICLSADVRTFDPSVQGPGGEDALTTERTEYVVDTYGMARDQVVETNRFVLRLIAPNASSFETDVPLQGNRLPPSVLSGRADSALTPRTHSASRRTTVRQSRSHRSMPKLGRPMPRSVRYARPSTKAVRSRATLSGCSHKTRCPVFS